MSRKSKGVVLRDQDAKARFKHQALLQDYHDLHKETDVMRNKLEAAIQRKLTLAAEVRFLRKRYASFVRANAMNLSFEKEKHLLQPNSHKQKAKQVKEQSYSRNDTRGCGLTLVPVSKPMSKKKYHTLKEVTQHHKKALPGGKTNLRKEVLAQFTAPVLDLNQKARMHGVNESALRNSTVPFDLNQDSSSRPSGKDGSLPSRALIFDLNEISTGDEDFQSNAEGTKLDEVKKSSIRGLSDDMQNDLKLSIICRNAAGEGPSRIGKRKISWQDPVALRV